MKVNWTKKPKKQSTKESQPTKKSKKRKRAVDALMEFRKAKKECDIKIKRGTKTQTLKKIDAQCISTYHLYNQDKVVLKSADEEIPRNKDGEIEVLCLVEEILSVLESKPKEGAK